MQSGDRGGRPAGPLTAGAPPVLCVLCVDHGRAAVCAVWRSRQSSPAAPERPRAPSAGPLPAPPPPKPGRETPSTRCFTTEPEPGGPEPAASTFQSQQMLLLGLVDVHGLHPAGRAAEREEPRTLRRRQQPRPSQAAARREGLQLPGFRGRPRRGTAPRSLRGTMGIVVSQFCRAAPAPAGWWRRRWRLSLLPAGPLRSALPEMAALAVNKAGPEGGRGPGGGGRGPAGAAVKVRRRLGPAPAAGRAVPDGNGAREACGAGCVCPLGCRA